jgi:hypothetical protein
MNTPILKLRKNRFSALRALLYVGLMLLFAVTTSVVSGTPLNRFRILIDTNQMNISEINQMNVYTYNPLAVDGVWAITQNHCGLSCTCVNEGFSQNNPDVPPSMWPNVFLKLNGATWTISEDEANWFLKEINNNARVAAQSYIYPSPVRESLAYYEYFPLLPPDCENDPPTCGPNIDSQQIESEVPLFGDRIIFLSRNYIERKPVESGEAYWVREGLTAPHAAGVVFEINPGTIANTTSPDFNKAVDGINYTLGQGKNCYLLLPPNWNGPPPYNHRNNHGDPPDYAADIQEVITYLNGRVPLNNPNLFIVLAVYGRDDMPPPAPPCSPTPPPAGYVPSGPGFLTGQGTTGYNNSVLAAARALQTLRNSILPQGTIGFIDSVTGSGASGWTLDPETFAASAEAISVHLYVNGPAGSGTFVGAATANISRPDVNTATGFLGNHGFNVPIPPAYLDGHWHQWYAYGISASGQPGKNTLLGNSPIITILPDTIAPTVWLLAPNNNAHVRGTVIIGADAADNVAVVGVQFKIDGANFGAEVPPSRGVGPDPSSTSGKTTAAAPGPHPDTAYPFQISWNTTGWAAGNHTLTAVARDAAGNTTTSSPPRTVTVDNTAPTGVAISSPFQNACVGGTALTVTATASDPNMASVQFKLDGNNLGALDTTAPYSVVWNTTTATQTVHTLTAVAKDLAGNTTTSPNRTVTVDNTSPTGVAITAPANGSTVAGVVTVSATASDNCAMIGVQFTLDGVNLGTLDRTVPYSISWNTLSSPSGLHTLRAVAIDQAGTPPTTSAPVTVTVNNNSDQ